MRGNFTRERVSKDVNTVLCTCERERAEFVGASATRIRAGRYTVCASGSADRAYR